MGTLSGLAVLGAVAMSGEGGGGGGGRGSFKGKVVWITGASSGIGESLVTIAPLISLIRSPHQETKNPTPGMAPRTPSTLLACRRHIVSPRGPRAPQALRFHRAGARVILSARRSVELERVKALCLEQAGDSLLDPVVLPLDLSKPEEMAGKAAEAKKLVGGRNIDILVNNVGDAPCPHAYLIIPPTRPRLVCDQVAGCRAGCRPVLWPRTWGGRWTRGS